MTEEKFPAAGPWPPGGGFEKRLKNSHPDCPHCEDGLVPLGPHGGWKLCSDCHSAREVEGLDPHPQLDDDDLRDIPPTIVLGED